MKDQIKQLARRTHTEYSAETEVEYAFMLGLWWNSIPEYMLPQIEKGVSYNLPAEWKLTWEIAPTFKFEFISDTATSWHKCYQDLRQMGWQRAKVHRDGGLLQYLLEIEDLGKPEGYIQTTFHLRISIATCQRVKVGEKTVVEEIFEVKCEGLEDFVDNEPASEFTPAMYPGQVDQIAELPDGAMVVIDDKTKNNIDEARAANRPVPKPVFIPPAGDDKFDDDIPF